VITRPIPLDAPLYVSRPILPPLDDFVSDLEEIWASQLLTNMGPFHVRLERALNQRVGFGHLSLWNNGTTALLAALAALDLHGEVVVTPFTFPATVHAIAALGLTPVFADIDDSTMTLSPERVLDKLTPSTTAIVATHIYGMFCDTAALAAIAERYSLRVVYDGAHSFGRHQPVFPEGAASLGDITMLSFHATKLFHSVEGGALITTDAEVHDRLGMIRNFGIRSEDVVDGIGLNGKMSEMHAAMGLRVLSQLDGEIDRRAELADVYVKRLASLDGVWVAAGNGPSSQYFVVRVNEAEFGTSRDDLHNTLRDFNIISRRYFYPLCSDVAPYSSHPSARELPIAARAASECLALPLYGGMDEDTVNRVCDVIEWQASTGEGRRA
jgi:dTDP-4-amino-4,6-dideoxygalactose transaminase